MTGELALQLLIVLLIAVHGAIAVARQVLQHRGIERILKAGGAGTRLIARSGTGWSVEVAATDTNTLGQGTSQQQRGEDASGAQR